MAVTFENQREIIAFLPDTNTEAKEEDKIEFQPYASAAIFHISIYEIYLPCTFVRNEKYKMKVKNIAD